MTKPGLPLAPMPSHGDRRIKVLWVAAFNLAVIWLLLTRIDPDVRHRLATFELTALVVTPLILFYAQSGWRISQWGAPLVAVLSITALTYSLLHEGSHLLGVYAIGSRPVEVHLIPRLWEGQFSTGASVSSEPVDGWLGALPGLARYVKDVAFLTAALWIFRNIPIAGPFLRGLVYAFFCLAPLFDVVNNYSIMLFFGEVPGNDFYGTALRWGAPAAHAIGSVMSLFALGVSAWILAVYSHKPVAPRAPASIALPQFAGK